MAKREKKPVHKVVIPSLTLTTIKKALNPFVIRVLEPLYMQKKCSYFSSFFIIVRIFFIFLFDTSSKSVRKPEISCKASVRPVLS